MGRPVSSRRAVRKGAAVAEKDAPEPKVIAVGTTFVYFRRRRRRPPRPAAQASSGARRAGRHVQKARWGAASNLRDIGYIRRRVRMKSQIRVKGPNHLPRHSPKRWHDD